MNQSLKFEFNVFVTGSFTVKKYWGSMHVFQTCNSTLFVFEGTFWDCKFIIDYCCCKTLHWLNPRLMFQRFMHILSDWLQTTVSLYIFEATTFLLIKFKVCVLKCQVYCMVKCPSCLTGYKMKPLIAISCWVELRGCLSKVGVSENVQCIRKGWDNIFPLPLSILY